MKKLVAILFLFQFLNCGTDQGKESTFNYWVKNDSGKTIKIKSFRNYPDNVTVINTENVIIPINGVLSKSVKEGPGESYNFTNFFNGDSIVVIFDNSKLIKLSAKDFSNTRNPLNVGIYNKANELFVFNIDDYNNAQTCTGTCE